MRISALMRRESSIVIAIIAVVWLANYVHYMEFGFYEDDWYYFPSVYGTSFSGLIRLRISQCFFQGRPLQVLIQALVACAGASFGSIPFLYFLTFLFSTTKVVLGYAVVRLRFDRQFAALAAILFAISPLTTVRQSLNNELSIAPAFAFAFAGILLYAYRREAGSYVMGVLALLTYEPMFFVFAGAPLFVRGLSVSRDRGRLARHAGWCLAVFLGLFWLRHYTGESRSAMAA